MFLTVLLSCLLMVAPGLGDDCGEHMIEMMKQMREEMQEERKEEVMVMRKEIGEEMREERREEVEAMRKEITDERGEEVMVMRKEMTVIKQEKLELEEKVIDLTKRLEIHAKKIVEVELKSTRDLPYVMICGYRNDWTAPSSTITYERLSADYTNADRPGGGDGNLDITTGTFTALTPGHYTITYSGHAYLNAGEVVDIFLYHNGEDLGPEGQWISSSDSSSRDQGSKSLVSHH